MYDTKLSGLERCLISEIRLDRPRPGSKVFLCLASGCTHTYIHPSLMSFQWRHNERDGVSNRRRLDGLFRHRSNKTSKLRITGLCEGNYPHKGPVTRKMFPFDDVIMVTYAVRCVNARPPALAVWSTLAQVSRWYLTWTTVDLSVRFSKVHWRFSGGNLTSHGGGGGGDANKVWIYCIKGAIPSTVFYRW